MKSNVAIITARGGSKRIPRKNIKLFCGKPMLAWPILAAQASNLFSEIIISTEDAEIAEIAKQYGATAPFIRPQELADDHTPTAPVLEHALRWLQAKDNLPQFACCIYPTAPFIQAEDLIRGLNELKEHHAHSAHSVTTFDFPILRAYHVNTDGSVSYHWPENMQTRSQDLPEFLHDAGQFYWVNTDFFLQHPNHLLGPVARPVRLPRHRVQDLDTYEDWEVAETMARAMNLGK